MGLCLDGKENTECRALSAAGSQRCRAEAALRPRSTPHLTDSVQVAVLVTGHLKRAADIENGPAALGDLLKMQARSVGVCEMQRNRRVRAGCCSAPETVAHLGGCCLLHDRDNDGVLRDDNGVLRGLRLVLRRLWVRLGGLRLGLGRLGVGLGRLGVGLATSGCHVSAGISLQGGEDGAAVCAAPSVRSCAGLCLFSKKRPPRMNHPCQRRRRRRWRR